MGEIRTMVERIIFDLDDTLLDTGRFYRKQLDEFADKAANYFGPEVTRERALTAQQEIDRQELKRLGMDKKRFPESLVKTWEYLCKEQERSPHRIDLEECARIGWDVYRQVPEPLAGMQSTLDRLYSRFQLILYTMGDPEIQTEKIDYHDLAKWFTEIHIVPMKDRDTLKPLVRPRPPEQVGIVGDSLRGEIQPGLELGLRVVHRETLSNWHYHEVELSEDYPVIRELPELLDIFP